ncbi:MAG TPA: class I SAM-dependent methyltransferase [Thermoanaerobaculia bacterium]|nr:class I SAM-dependent methyltransferase [Thermoanaerobaculia bacterium]
MQPVFILEEPLYHRVRIGEVNRFRGVLLGADRVQFVRNGAVIAEAEVNQPCPELAWLVHVPNATTSRFIADVLVEPDATIEIKSGEETLFVYRVPELDRAMWDRVAALPVPPPDVVATTQGGTNVESYRDSIFTGFQTTAVLLETDVSRIRDVIEVGCGTGRLLAGWYCDDPTRGLTGVDINAGLIAWTRANLPDVAQWDVCALYPPLNLEGGRFDLALFGSVFTHLPLDCQKAWLRETQRLLRPGGYAVITLHGETHAHLLLDEPTRERYYKEGHLEFAAAAEGANAYSTFHTPEFARELFRDFAEVRMHPRGDVQRGLFPMGSLQDVWVLRN